MCQATAAIYQTFRGLSLAFICDDALTIDRYICYKNIVEDEWMLLSTCSRIVDVSNIHPFMDILNIELFLIKGDHS